MAKNKKLISILTMPVVIPNTSSNKEAVDEGKKIKPGFLEKLNISLKDFEMINLE